MAVDTEQCLSASVLRCLPGSFPSRALPCLCFPWPLPPFSPPSLLPAMDHFLAACSFRPFLMSRFFFVHLLRLSWSHPQSPQLPCRRLTTRRPSLLMWFTAAPLSALLPRSTIPLPALHGPLPPLLPLSRPAAPLAARRPIAVFSAGLVTRVVLDPVRHHAGQTSSHQPLRDTLKGSSLVFPRQ